MKTIHQIQVTILVQLLLCVDLSLSECGKETKEFMSCWYKARDKLRSKTLPFENFQKQISKCFSDNGCKDVQLESEDYQDQVKNEKEEKCYAQLKNAIKKRAEKCMQGVLDKDFELPPFVATEPFSYVSYPLAHEAYQMVVNTSICPATANTTKVTDCVNNAFEKVFSRRYCKSPFTTAIEFDNSMAHYCDANCFSKLSSNCNSTLNTTYPAVCSCVLQPETPAKSFDKEINEYIKCAGRSVNDTSNQFIVQAATQQLVGYYCEADPKDPCTQSTLNDDANQYKPINLPI